MILNRYCLEKRPGNGRSYRGRKKAITWILIKKEKKRFSYIVKYVNYSSIHQFIYRKKVKLRRTNGQLLPRKCCLNLPRRSSYLTAHWTRLLTNLVALVTWRRWPGVKVVLHARVSQKARGMRPEPQTQMLTVHWIASTFKRWECWYLMD